MAKLTIVAIVLLFSTIAFSQSPTELDRENGFNGVKFESTSSSNPNLQLIYSSRNGNIKKYIDPTESLMFYDFKLYKVVYTYYKSHLFSIRVTASNSNKQTLLTYFQAKYGKGYQENRFVDTVEWKGNQIKMWYDTYVSSDISFEIYTNVYNSEMANDK